MVPPRGNDPQLQDFQSYVQTIYTKAALSQLQYGSISTVEICLSLPEPLQL